jgi:hypothetical protein
MKLSDLIKQNKESQEDFLARTYWVMTMYPASKNKVYVWRSAQAKDLQIHDPEVWSMEKAEFYLKGLRSSLPEVKTLPPNITPEPKCQHDELLQIDANGSVKHMCAWCGEIIHEIKRTQE